MNFTKYSTQMLMTSQIIIFNLLVRYSRKKSTH